MGVNIFGQATIPTLQSMAADISDMSDALEAIRLSLSTAPASKPVNAPLRVTISSTGQASSQGIIWQTSDLIRIVGLIIGGANAGRYTLQIGSDISQAIWLIANQSLYLYFQGDDRWEVGRGATITVNAPSSGAWDLTLVYYPSDMLPPRND